MMIENYTNCDYELVLFIYINDADDDNYYGNDGNLCQWNS